MLTVPAAVQGILDTLTARGYEAFVVGGCVRDSLLGKEPEDWDVTTSALPEEIAALFSPSYRVLDTGLRHGTVTVLCEGRPVEITTYRVDGPYSDNRRPDSVRFTKSLREDLARRDFTINALAYHPAVGLVDYFSGQADLAARRICCVGDPDKRFEEDALRLLRALRFASVLGFSLEKMTGESLKRHAALLQTIAAERVAAELQKLICGQAVFPVLMEYAPVLFAVLPELAPAYQHPQYNRYHRYDIYEHTLRSVQAVPPSPVLRWAMLLHDSGKPACFTRDEDGVGHFYGHPQVSVRLANEALHRLRLDTHTITRVTTLITYHDERLVNQPACLKRWLCRLGEEAFRQLLEVQRADISAQNPDLLDRLQDIDAINASVEAILAAGDCFCLRDLQINGHDLAALGVHPGKAMGLLLEKLLEAVIDGRCTNTRADLLRLAGELLAGG